MDEKPKRKPKAAITVRYNGPDLTKRDTNWYSAKELERESRARLMEVLCKRPVLTKLYELAELALNNNDNETFINSMEKILRLEHESDANALKAAAIVTREYVVVANERVRREGTWRVRASEFSIGY